MCTSFTLERRNCDDPVISGRSMDWMKQMPTVVNFVPRSQNFPEMPIDNEMKWKNKYAFVGTLHRYANRVEYTDGLNEKGLSAASLWLEVTKYAEPSCHSQILAADHVVSYILSNFKNVEDVKAALSKISVVASILDSTGLIKWTLHYIITDAKGNHLIIEYINGKMKTYTDDIGVITNDPDYRWHLTNISNYKGLSLSDIPERPKDFYMSGTGQIGIPGDPTAPSRFIRAELLRRSKFTKTSIKEWVGVAHQILRTLSIPAGTVYYPNSNECDWTQWGVIRDNTNLTYYFFTDFNSTLYGIHLKDLDFNGTTQKQISIVQPNWYVDYTGELK